MSALKNATAPPRINNVYHMANGMIAVFDQRGQQMPEYQGRVDEVGEKIKANAPRSATFHCWHMPCDLCKGFW